MQYVRVELEEAVQGSEWAPGSPSEILQLTTSEEKRLKKWSRAALKVVKCNWKFVMGYLAKELPGLF